MTIRDATPDDAVAACYVLKELISRLCVADHGRAVGTLTSTETAHRFYQSAGYRDDGMPTGKFGTSSGYPMSKKIVAPR